MNHCKSIMVTGCEAEFIKRVINQIKTAAIQYEGEELDLSEVRGVEHIKANCKLAGVPSSVISLKANSVDTSAISPDKAPNLKKLDAVLIGDGDISQVPEIIFSNDCVFAIKANPSTLDLRVHYSVWKESTGVDHVSKLIVDCLSEEAIIRMKYPALHLEIRSDAIYVVRSFEPSPHVKISIPAN